MDWLPIDKPVTLLELSPEEAITLLVSSKTEWCSASLLVAKTGQAISQGVFLGYQKLEQRNGLTGPRIKIYHLKVWARGPGYVRHILPTGSYKQNYQEAVSRKRWCLGSYPTRMVRLPLYVNLQCRWGLSETAGWRPTSFWPKSLHLLILHQAQWV